MEKFKGTQGKWEIDRSVWQCQIHEVESHDLIGVIGHEDMPDEEIEANATLIAASPDLLEFAQVFSRKIHGGLTQRDINELTLLCKAALTKATTK